MTTDVSDPGPVETSAIPRARMKLGTDLLTKALDSAIQIPDMNPDAAEHLQGIASSLDDTRADYCNLLDDAAMSVRNAAAQAYLSLLLIHLDTALTVVIPHIEKARQSALDSPATNLAPAVVEAITTTRLQLEASIQELSALARSG